MGPTSSRDLGLMGRRNFIRRLAEIGVSTSAIKYLDPDRLRQLTDDPSDQVPRLRRVKHTNHEEVEIGAAPPEREPEFYTISRDEWEQIEGAIDAMQKIDRINRKNHGGNINTQLNISGDYSISVGVVKDPGVYDVGESPNTTIANVRNDLPAVAKGVAEEGAREVEIEIDIGFISPSKSEYEHKYRSQGVPGGAMITSCTLGTPAHDGSGYVLVTAGHCVSKDEKVHQPNPDESGSEIGTVVEVEDVNYSGYGDHFDAAIIDPSEDITYQFASDLGDDEYVGDIAGTYGWDALKDGVPTTVGKRGITTGHSSGSVDSVYESSLGRIDTKTFETTADEDNGDSGGPHYVPDQYNGDAYIAGIHRGVMNEGYSHAIAMEAIEDHFEITV